MTRRSVDIASFAHANPIPSASRIGPLVASSIVVGRDPGTQHVPESIEAQLTNLFVHVGELLREAGATWEDVIKMNFWVPSTADRAKINGPWLEHFPDPGSRPARHTQIGGDDARCDFLAYVCGDDADDRGSRGRAADTRR